METSSTAWQTALIGALEMQSALTETVLESAAEALIAAGPRTQKQHADEFGITEVTMSKIMSDLLRMDLIREWPINEW